MSKQIELALRWRPLLLIALLTFFAPLLECLAADELPTEHLPPLNSRGVIGLRWGNTLRQVQEGMRRNKATPQGGAKSEKDEQVSYTYGGEFFKRKGSVTLTFYRGKLWAATFAYPGDGGVYEQFHSLLTAQYGSATGEKPDSPPFWIAGSNKISLIRETERVTLSWKDANLAQKVRGEPGSPTFLDVDVEPANFPYIPQKLYQKWTPGEGFNAPFNPKNRGEFFGLAWNISPTQAHLIMSGRNRSVFRGSRERLPSELWLYSAPMQGKFCAVEMLFLSKKLRGVTLRFLPELQSTERLFRQMLEEFLSPPLVKNEREIWYYAKTSIVAEKSAQGVSYRFSPGNL